jgi:diadenosine tetraphosphate (Ap4A) HIT family hydrolase
MPRKVRGNDFALSVVNDVNHHDCEFCDHAALRAAEVCIENEYCLYASSSDPATDPEVLPGSGIIVPLAHRETPFDLTDDEWTATRELLLEAKAAIDERFSPDGYTLIWNCYPPGDRRHRTRTCT